MGNPSWPNFPGLPNLTQDGDGRPQLLDLIPGKQKGTPLTTQFFNPLLRKICDLQDMADTLSSTALSGTAGMADGDTAGVGMHINHGTGRVTFGAAGGNWRDLAWGSDVDSLSQQVQEGLQTAVSGTYGMTDGDSPGLGLHTNHTSGKPVYLDKTGSRDLALAADVQGLLSGTAGLAPGDTAGVGLHVNHGTGRPTFGAAGDSWRDLAWGSDVDALSQQVQEGLQTAVSGTYGLAGGDSPGLGLHTNHTSGKPVYLDKTGSRDLALAADVQGLLSGTYGMGGGDSAGLGLHTNGSTGKPVYLDKTGARDLALAADVQGVLSGTAGLAPGDTAGVGLHVNHASDRPTFGDDGGRWRDLALATDLDSRLPVSSPTASGSLTVNNGGAVMTVNPAVTFNNQLRGQISWGTRSWYPGGDGLIFRDNGNLLADATRQTSIQRFTTQGSHGQRIQFPQQFKSDDVQVMVMSMDSGGNSFHTVDRFSVDRYGFSLSINSWNGTGYGIEQRQTVIDVVAFGDM